MAANPTVKPVHVATLSDLLGLPELAGARVVPADADVQIPVRAVSADFGEDLTLDPDTLVLGRPEHAGAPCPGCVAVVACATIGAEPVVPLIVLAQSADLAAVTVAVSRAVNEPSRYSVGAIRRALREVLIAGSGFETIAEIGAEFAGDGVAILDSYGDVVAAEGVPAKVIDAIAAAVETARERDPMNVLAPIGETAVAGCRVVVVGGAQGQSGALVLTSRSADDSVVAEIAEACAVEFAREEARIEAESRLRGELIEELVAGETISRDAIIRRARLLGADLSNGAVGMIGTLKSDGSNEPIDERTGRRFLKHLRSVLDHEWPRALVDWSDGRILALLPTPADVGADGATGVDERAHEVARRLLSATRDTAGGMSVTLALSRHTLDPERLGAALDEAELALSIGERLGRLGEVVTFEETGTYKLLFQIFADRPDELSAFYESTLAPLVAYDEQYQTALVDTLSTYLELDGNLAATASTLYTHRHTVRYRLDRIAELAGLDVGKSDDREKLSLGLKAMRLLGRTVRSGADPERGGRGRG